MTLPSLILPKKPGSSHTVVLLLGGNLDNREALLNEALRLLESEVGPCIGASLLYESEPWGFPDKVHPFLNRVIVLQTLLSAQEVLEVALLVEIRLGRNREVEEGLYASRKLDVDILFYDDSQISTPSLTIPHPRMASRMFVLVPLAELMPRECHPVLGVTMEELLLACSDTLWVRRYR
ncbi:MAG: 2-amino-4-hydroxy-6-hydroxymethyldihydropteridine diphosphokinase [Bacteroidales bacterium]